MTGLGLGQSRLLLLPPSSPSLSLRLRLRLPSPCPCPSSPPPSLLSFSSSTFPAPPLPPSVTRSSISSPLLSLPHATAPDGGSGSASGSGGNNNNHDGGSNWNWSWNWDGGSHDHHNPFLLLYLLLLFLLPSTALAIALADDTTVLWEVSRGMRKKLLVRPHEDIVAADPTHSQGWTTLHWWRLSTDAALGLLLPHGYPHSVSSDYMEYSLWRGVQGIASQVSGVLSTQALLYAVGLGKGAIPTAAAINWVLKDGIGYLSKILLSKFGRHFDVNPKGWRLFADLIENAAHGMEILTPLFPQYFVFIGAAAGAGRSAAALIQSATRSCFFAGFSVQRNFAEVIAKGEAQGMVSKFIGIALGIALANKVGSSAPLALSSYAVVTAIHMYCNLKSYQAIQLRTLNPYRACLVFSEYLLTGQIPSVKVVNDEEPFFPSFPSLTVRKGDPEILSSEAKEAAAVICHRLKIGCKPSEVINNKKDAVALFELFKDEGYILTQSNGKFCVILKEMCSTEDMLKSVFQVNYLYWLERNMGLELRSVAEECTPTGMLHMSLDYVSREMVHAKHDAENIGWETNALIARPMPNRIRPLL